MEPLHLTHLIFLSAWGGLVLSEGVLELAVDDDAAARHVARVHYWIDLLVELPLLIGILATGTLLAARSRPLTPLHHVKIGASFVPIAMNLYCVWMVVARRRHYDEARLLRYYGGRVRLSAMIGAPFALVAAYLGLTYFRG